MIRTIMIITIVFAYIFTVGTFSKLYLADIYYTGSKQKLENGELKDASQYIKQAIKFNGKEPAYHRHKAKVWLTTSVWEDDAIVKQEALQELETAISLNPKNLTTLRNIIPLYYFLAVKDLSAVGNEDNVDKDYLPITRNFYSGLKETYDNDLGIYADIAKYEKRLGLEEDYMQTKEKASEMREELVKWHESFR